MGNLFKIASNHRREVERIATSSGYNLNSRFFSLRPGISFGEPIEKREREEGIEKERKINNSKQSYIYLKLCGQQARVSGRVCFISKGLIEKRKERNLERGFNPSVGKVKQEQDQQQQQEKNKKKKKKKKKKPQKKKKKKKKKKS